MLLYVFLYIFLIKYILSHIFLYINKLLTPMRLFFNIDYFIISIKISYYTKTHNSSNKNY